MTPRPTAILRSPDFLGHDTGYHVERAARIVAIERELERRSLLDNRPELPFDPAPDEAILAVHAPELLEHLEHVAAIGGGWIDQDTIVRPDSVAVARLAAGAAIAGVNGILDREIDHAMVLGRPPGHHATRDQAMGFCLLNTIAIAAGAAIARGLERVAILDWDVHHGNGTQGIFYSRSDVLYCSLHQSPLFPGTGAARERGAGEGEGTTVNVPLRPGTSGATFLDAFQTLVVPAIDAFHPQLVLVSAGYDAHEEDPIGSLRVTDDAFRTLMADAIGLADRHCEGRLLAVLEGGYNTDALARSVADAIEVLDGNLTSD